MLKTNDFSDRFFFNFWRVLDFQVLGVGPLFNSKNQIFSLFFWCCSFLSIFARFGKVWGGFRDAVHLGHFWLHFRKLVLLMLSKSALEAPGVVFKSIYKGFTNSCEKVLKSILGWIRIVVSRIWCKQMLETNIEKRSARANSFWMRPHALSPSRSPFAFILSSGSVAVGVRCLNYFN